MNNGGRDLTGIVGRTASLFLGALLVERAFTAWFGPVWGAVAALGGLALVLLGIWLWARRNSAR